MSNSLKLTGIILSESEYSEYGKRLVILTKEKGRITAFARSARKQNNPLTGVTMPFIFGVFDVFAGRDAYSLNSVEVKDYFEGLRKDLDAVCYAAYFSELTEYFSVDEHSDRELLNLLYVTFKAMLSGKISKKLIRSIFEIKLLQIEGFGVNVFSCSSCGSEEGHFFKAELGGIICDECRSSGERLIHLKDSTLYTLQYIYSTDLKRLYSFTVSEEVEKNLVEICRDLSDTFIEKKMKSLEMLELI
ncbi:MAG: DNA repair protein RecO [Lachnospiraceae bacterium]|nr:DNA repair protein RecO [Lachnospiraceae bacterium]